MGTNRAVVITLVVLVSVSMLVGLIVWPASPCYDNTATSPQIEFEVVYNSSTEVLTIIHQRGNRLTDTNTDSLTVRIRPADAQDYSTRYVLVSDSKGGYPVELGETWSFSNVSVDNRSLSAGDTVRIHWAGPDDIPSYCPNRDEEQGTVAKLVIEGDG